MVFLALEHGDSTKFMGEIIDAGPGLIVDLAADFRIQDGALHARHYGAHAAPALVHHFRYGLADVLGSVAARRPRDRGAGLFRHGGATGAVCHRGSAARGARR